MIDGPGKRSAYSIAVDASALHSSTNGVGRYLRETLGRMVRIAKVERPFLRWRVYCRRSLDIYGGDTIRWRQDHMPSTLGRVLAPLFSCPVFAYRDAPDVFWGPAHRLPWWLPPTTKAVVTVHDLSWVHVSKTMRKVGYFLDRVMMPSAIRRASLIIAVSQSTANQIESIWPEAKEKMMVVPLGISTSEKIFPLHRLSLNLTERQYFLFVGTLEPRKNLERLLKAHALGVARRPNWPKLVVVGERGWGVDSPQELAKRVGCGKETIFLGRVRDDELSTLYANALALTMPSIYEGFGLPLVEAMSVGTPVVTSNLSSMPEVVGNAGVLVDPYSIEDIYRGLVVFLDNPGCRLELSASAIDRSRLYSWETTARVTLDELSRLAFRTR